MKEWAPGLPLVKSQRAKMLLHIFLLLPLARSQDYASDYPTKEAPDAYTFYDSVEDYELNIPSYDYDTTLSETLVQVNDNTENVDLNDMCRVSSGESNIVMDLIESLGDDFSQETSPKELPITGRVGSDIELELVFPSGYSIFKTQDKSIHLTEPLDRDQNDLSSIVFQVTCTVLRTGKRRTIPVIVRISDLNDNSPRFIGTPYTISLPENTPVNATVFTGLKAEDMDSGNNMQIEYSVVPGDGSVNDGFGYFAINLPHQGFITVAKQLDFESTKNYYVNILATDKALDPASRKTSMTVLTVNLEDSDDLDPAFAHPLYTSRVVSGVTAGVLDIKPDKIQAEDQDSLRSEIFYTFVSGKPNFYGDYFSIDRRTGVVRQTRSLDRETASEFEMIIMAEENTQHRRRARTKLMIKVEAKDIHAPELSVSASEGYIDENSPVGTLVLDRNKRPIKFRVTDQDLVSEGQKPPYIYEFTSSQFDQNADSELIAKDGSLDRDAPSQPMLIVQVVAREDLPNGKASSPVSIRIHLRDMNDNPPILPAIAPITIQAGNSRRKIAQMNATDIDEDDSIRYRILHVSNGGKRIFYVNPSNGDVEVLGRAVAGDSYSITIVAMDNSGATSQTILEVNVTPGPNVRPPYFDKIVYDVTVSEGSPRHSSVITVSAKDPEGATVTYSIISGNNLEHFSIGESTGVIRVMQPLDREELRRYSLMIKAEDEDKKASTATVNIIVTDVNDQNPEFQNLPYSFRVKEGEIDAFVGRVFAEDKDVEENANISYSVPNESPFEIEKFSGKITTKLSLDFEANQVHYVVVTAKDGGKVPRLATATATILVQDISDETPFFPQKVYEATVPENLNDFIITTVTAEDKDTLPQITYRIMQGDVTKFAIDPATGVIRTSQGLDFERAKEHVIIVGTEQGQTETKNNSDSTCKVIITVQDVNDIPPMFTRMPPGNTIQVRNDAKINEKIGSVEATDSDGTAPGNQVRYQLVEDQSSDRAAKYFRIDPDTGEIVLQGDLTNELYEEYRLMIRAYDQGEPSLDSTATVVVIVQQVVTVPPNSGVGFSDLEHLIEVMENTPQEAILKTLTLSMKPKRNIKIRCEVIEAFDKNGKSSTTLFRGELNDNKDCNLILARSGLDHEIMDEYSIKMTLNTLTAFVNPNRMEARINVTVQDKNDNRPRFTYDAPYNRLIKDKYLAIVSEFTPVREEIFQVMATDKDSGEYGMIKYELSPDTDTTTRQYFRIESDTGAVVVAKNFENVPDDVLPFRLIITARDNPGRMDDSKMEKTMLVINLVREGYFMVLSVKDTPPKEMELKESQLAQTIQEQTGLVIGVDQILPAQQESINGSCCEENPDGSDIWFYAIDPETQKILSYNDSTIVEHISGKSAQTSLKYTITGDLHVQASEIRAPHQPQPLTTAIPVSTSVKSLEIERYHGYPAVLIAIGCLIFALSLTAIIYLLILYAKYKYAKDRAQRMVVIPRYEPVFVEPNLKEYETQVLQMSVAIDDADSGDLKLDFSNRSHVFDPGFNLDSVSYITHETSASASPVSDNEPIASHSTFRAATIMGRPVVRNLSNRLKDHYREGQKPVHNPMYDKSSDSDDAHDGVMNPSFTNDNVMFRGRKDFNTSTPKRASSFKSPIDATTQL